MKKRKNEKIWDTRYRFGDEKQDAAVRRMAQEMNISETFAVLLYNRGYHTTAEAQRFLRYEETDFHDPYLLADMEKAVERILAAVERGEKIYIYGDYDVDGVTSVSMLYLYLRSLGAEAGIKIPKREGEGYGVSMSGVDAIAQAGCTLIITVDTGITANAEVEHARELGVDFVVTDHHECRSELPAACAVVNPHRPDCTYPFKELAGVGVIFKVICACEMKRCRENGTPLSQGLHRVIWEYSDLAAVGTIADVMPVVDENRLIIGMGISRMEKSCRPGLAALLDASAKKSDMSGVRKVTSRTIGFGIAPRINAAGRISDALIAVKLLLEEDPEKAKACAEELCEINRRRQSEENRIATEAYEMIENNAESDNDYVIVLASNHWKQGIIGIVSSRITERYGLPSILVSFCGVEDGDEDPMDDGKGSGRSIKGMNLVEALSWCDELLLRYGGHELAAGLTVKRANLPEFRRKINEYAREHLSEEIFRVHLEADCEISMRELTMKFAQELRLLEPCGTSNATGNATPSFIMRNVTVRRLYHTRDGNHTVLQLESDGLCMTGMYYGVGEGAVGFEAGDSIDLYFNVEINDFRGVQSVQMIVKDAQVSHRFVSRLAHEKERYEEIRQGAEFDDGEDFVPSRDDFARVYTVLRREFRAGTSVLDQKGIMKLVNLPQLPVLNYVKCKYILRILNELKICEIEEIDEDIYRFRIFFNAAKTNIERSSILKKLKGQCNAHCHQGI